jgi:signal transduction histidine kinase
MTVGGHAMGLLLVAWSEGEGRAAFESTEPLKRYADQAALTLTAATAQRDRARTTLLEDRERIARDMHDVVIQRLFATGLGLQSAVRVAGHPYVQARLDDAVTELDQAIKDIRASIFALHDQHLIPFSTVISDLVGGFAEPLGFGPELVLDGSVDAMPEQVRADLLAVVREALSNVARHAQAGAATVLVDVGPARLVVSVEDDGVGFTDTGRRSGLTNLDERAIRHGGRLIVAQPDGAVPGTRLVWEVPVGPS